METLYIGFLILIIIILCSGALLSTCITVVSYRSRTKDGFQNPRDLITFFIGLSSALFQGFHLSCNVLVLIRSDVFSTFNVCMVSINVVSIIFVFFTICLTSWLCTFYCIKLVSFHHRLIIFLKSRLTTLFPWIIGGTFGMSIILLIIQLGVIFMSVPLDNTNNSTNYCRRLNDKYISNIRRTVFGASFIISFPFLLILVSLGSTLTSLILHIWRVQNSSNVGTSHLRAHIKAAKTMILLLVLNVTYFILQILLIEDLLAFSPPLTWICSVFYVSYWKLQALILIFRNKNLKVILQSPLLTCFKLKYDSNR